MKWWHWTLVVTGALVFFGAPRVAKVVVAMSEKKRLEGLRPHVREALASLRAALKARGVETFVGSTLRTSEQTAANVAAGRSSASLKTSWHELGRAVDLYPIGPDGKPDLAGRHTELFRIMHDVAKAQGWRGLAFDAKGQKKYLTTVKGPVWDGGHLEWTDGLTITQAETADKARYS